MKNKTVVIGVCGGIAAYKACEIVSALVKKNINVRVVMTESATEFVAPLTFSTLSGNKVITDMFEKIASYEVEHISVAKEADLFVIVPATANIIGKIANGIADDFLSTTVMATKAPVLIAPAMNSGMWTNKIVSENVEKLKNHGYEFVMPGEGRLACGDVGVGKLASVEDILEHIEIMLCKKKDLKGKRVLVTAGATIEPIDPIRYITNHSSGKMGYAVAKEAKKRGADVTLVAGNTSLIDPYGVEVIKVTTARSMADVVLKLSEKADIIVKSAAVADFRPKTVAQNKIKKKDGEFTIELEKNPDILKMLGENKDDKVLVGFCMETQDLIDNAKLKLESKNLDMIVANSLNDEGAGFKSDTNVVTVLTKDGACDKYPVMSKNDVAEVIFDRIAKL